MNITLHQLNVLKAVKTHSSLTAVANILHITQPAVSNILKQLELNCGYSLTEKIGKKIFLTQAGELLVKAAIDIHETLESAMAEVKALHGKLAGTMNVAIVSTAKYFAPRLLGEFQKKYPSVKIKLTVCNRQQAIDILKNNTSDFLVMSQPPEDIAIETYRFYDDQLVVITSPELKFDKKIKNLKDLNDEAWIIREPGSGTLIVMKRLFKKNKMLPNVTMEVSNNESIKQLIMANMGISIVSRQSVELELRYNHLKILPINGFPITHPWYIVMNKQKHINAITKKFFNHIKSHTTIK